MILSRRYDCHKGFDFIRDADDGGDDWFNAAVKKKSDNEEKIEAKKELKVLKEKNERMEVYHTPVQDP